jgi:hypothetical protein
MRGATLGNILTDFRSECRISSNAAHNVGVRDRHIALLQRTQKWLWEDFDWPTLRVERWIQVQAGQRYYAPPADMNIDRIQKVELKDGGRFIPIVAGIDIEHYATYDPELDERAYPPRRWRISENEDIELWPIPDTNADDDTREGYVKLTGIRNLSTFVAETDTADLDDQLIVLFAAAEELAAIGAKDAELKRVAARARYDKLRGAQMPRRVFSLLADRDEEYKRRRVLPNAIYRAS